MNYEILLVLYIDQWSISKPFLQMALYYLEQPMSLYHQALPLHKVEQESYTSREKLDSQSNKKKGL
jgi:hypothetical protein